MSLQVMKIDLRYIEAGDVSGKVVNVYDSYANALVHGSTGLVADMEPVARLTGLPTGTPVVQKEKVTGIETDINGQLWLALDRNTPVYYGAVVAGNVSNPIIIRPDQDIIT